VDGDGATDNNDAIRATKTNMLNPADPAFGTDPTDYDYRFVKAEEFTWYHYPQAYLGGWRPDASKVLIDSDDVDVVYPYSMMPGDGEGPTLDVVIWHTRDDMTDGELDALALAVLVPPHPGDANGDRKVDVFDLAALANHYQTGTNLTWTQGDFTGDGEVNVFDLAVLANNYGYDGTVGGEAIPEPATMMLLAGGLVPMVLRRRRK